MRAHLESLLRPPALQRLAVSGYVLVVTVFAAARLLRVYPWNDRIFDLWAYWSTRDGLDYAAAHPGASGAYIYSPAFAQLISPLTALALPEFAALWTVLVAAVFYWLVGWRAFFIGLLAPVTMSIAIGQTDVFMAAVVVLGFRWPAAWVFAVITKLTPGVGMLWFAARREWRSFGIAVGATVLVVGGSALLDPVGWKGWITMLGRFEFPTQADGIYLPVPLPVRLPIAVALLFWGARANRRWVVPVAAVIAAPTLWINTPTILVSILPMTALAADSPAGRWLRAPEGRPIISTLRVRRQARRVRLTLLRELAR